MNHRNPIIKLLGAAFLIGTVATSCYDYAKIPAVELAAFESEITMEAAGGSYELMFYTNGSYHIEYLTEVDWMTLFAETYDGNSGGVDDDVAILTITCTPNEGFKRRVDFVLCSDLDTRRDTVIVKQKSVADAFLEFDEASIILPGAGGTTTSTVRTNVGFDEMSVEIIYTDVNNANWVSEFCVIDSDSDEREMRIVTDPNTDEVNPRVATVALSFKDGWGDVVAVNFVLLQCNAKEEAGREITFEEFHNEYADGIIYDYVQIRGIVVSNKDGGNAGEPEQTTTSSINFTPTATTVYLESEDGKYGINVQTATEDDNVFDQFDHITLLLYGASGSLIEDDPAAPALYQITGVDKTMILSRTSGSIDDVPVKERAIGELTDDDIYTYVKLVNVELPIRKGSIFPVDGGFANESNQQRITKYPLLVRDIKGDDLYLLTNDRCLYRRDGTRLPYGSGSLYGVVVHEHFPRYEWRTGADPSQIYSDETLANIGRYQIRHQTKEDIWRDMNDDFEDGFSALLCEYRYKVIKNSKIVPSYGTKDDSGNLVLNGYITHTYTGYSGTSGTHFAQGATTYDYLGPTGNSASSMNGQNYGNKNGIGILIDAEHEDYTTYRPSKTTTNRDGILEMACEFCTHSYCGYGASGWSEENAVNENYVDVLNYGSDSNRGKGQTGSGAEMDLANTYWWDYDTDSPYSILIYFSTKDIVSDVVSMQIYIRGYSGSLFTPDFWTAEWAESENATTWNTISDFTVPEPIMTSFPNLWALPAHKPINFKLPTSILGKENVYVRLHPTSDVCGSGTEYADSHLSDSSSGHGVSLSYFAIRYNK